MLPFRLVTIGQALHWIDQQKVLGNIIQLLVKGGGLAVVSGKSIWNGTEEWQRKTVEVIKSSILTLGVRISPHPEPGFSKT